MFVVGNNLNCIFFVITYLQMNMSCITDLIIENIRQTNQHSKIMFDKYLFKNYNIYGKIGKKTSY